MSIISAPSEFIYFEQIKEHKEIKEKIMDKIKELLQTDEVKENKPFKDCIFKTSFRKGKVNSFLLDDFIVKKLVWDPLDSLINKYNKLNFFKISVSSTIVTGCWFNAYEKTNFQEIHAHKANPIYRFNNIYTPSFSLVYILHDENMANSTVFKFNNTDFIWNFINKNGSIDTSKIKNIREGSVIIFPYTFQHFVTPVMKSRMSIAYNLASY